MSEARVKLSLIDGRMVEIEGSEAFVSAQLEKFGESIGAGVSGPGRANAGADNADGGDGQAAVDHAPVPPIVMPPVEVPPVDMLEDIFAATTDGVRIVVDVPGVSVHQKMANAGKLLAYGLAKLQTRNLVGFDEVKEACVAQHCYDAAHLASSLKRQRSAFVFAGRRKRQTFALTASGTSEAEKMIAAIRAAGRPRVVHR